MDELIQLELKWYVRQRLFIEALIRGALVNYFLKLMHLEPDREHPSPKVQQIVVPNKDEIQPWIWGD